MIAGNWFAALPVRAPRDWIAGLRRNAPPGLRWMHPDDLHLTLAFLGREDPQHLTAVHEIVQGIPFSGATVTPGSLLLLPGPRRFSVAAFALDRGAAAIGSLLETWRAPLLEAAGRPPDTRPPLPHITVARADRTHPGFAPGRISAWARSLPRCVGQLQVRPPVLYGWSAEYEEAARRGLPKFRVMP